MFYLYINFHYLYLPLETELCLAPYYYISGIYSIELNYLKAKMITVLTDFIGYSVGGKMQIPSYLVP